MERNRLITIAAGLACILIGVDGLVYYLIRAAHVAGIEQAGFFWGISTAFFLLIMVGLFILGPIFYSERGLQNLGSTDDGEEVRV